MSFSKLESNKIYDSQKFIGLSYNHPIVQEEMKKWAFKIMEFQKSNYNIIKKQYI